MTPKEKAKELVDGFRHLVDSTGDDLYFSHEEQTKKAKQCALICVDEIMCESTNDIAFYYYKKVKQEIEKL